MLTALTLADTSEVPVATLMLSYWTQCLPGGAVIVVLPQAAWWGPQPGCC